MAEQAEANSRGVRSTHLEPRRTIALEVRLTSLGYVVFNGSEKLLDWGVWRFKRKDPEMIAALSMRLGSLLSVHNPDTVVTRRREYPSHLHRRQFLEILRSIETTAHPQAKVHVLTRGRVQRYFASSGSSTKYEIAQGLTRKFEELSWTLPRPRKPFESEPRAMLIFDAVATGVAFLENKSAADD